MAPDAWTSTKAFSVYNALFKAGPLKEPEIVTFLQKSFRDDIDDAYVSLGVGYLFAKQMISTTQDGRLELAKPGKRVKRVNDDVDLDWA